MQNVLEDVPDFAERKRLLESLKNRLEALLSTKLVTAFNGHLLGRASVLLIQKTLMFQLAVFSEDFFLHSLCFHSKSLLKILLHCPTLLYSDRSSYLTIGKYFPSHIEIVFDKICVF